MRVHAELDDVIVIDVVIHIRGADRQQRQKAEGCDAAHLEHGRETDARGQHDQPRQRDAAQQHTR